MAYRYDDGVTSAMRFTVSVCALISVGLVHAADAREPSAMVIACGVLFDGDAPPRADMRIVIQADRIVAVLAAGDPLPASAKGSEEVDLRDHTCLPGLIDLHVHLTERPEDAADLTVYFRRTRVEQMALSRAQAAATVAAGFTSVRNLGAYIQGVDLSLRDAINRGELLGPRMQVSGYYLTIPGGGGDLLVPSVPESRTPNFVRGGVARGASQFRAKAERALASGVDVLKVIASGAVLAYGGVPGKPEMTREELSAVVAVARERGVRVAAHAHGAESIRAAIEAGVSTIEHASLIDDAGIDLAAKQGVPLVMDVYNGDYIDTEGRKQGWPAEFLKNNTDTTEAQRVAFSKAVARGSMIAYGTDAGVFPHGDNAKQFRVMVERGMTPLQAMRSATSMAAAAMGWEDRVGSLSPGKFADVIAVRGDPLADITVLERIDVVLLGGRIVKRRAPP
jgi:imidazolonepropionase-like amidohydrolase